LLFTGSVFLSLITCILFSAKIMCLTVKHKKRLVIDKLLFIVFRELLSFAKYVTRSLLLSLHLGDEYIVQLGIKKTHHVALMKTSWYSSRKLCGCPAIFLHQNSPDLCLGDYWECVTTATKCV